MADIDMTEEQLIHGLRKVMAALVDQVALNRIATRMSASEWDADCMDDIAAIVRGTGRTIADLDDVEWDGENLPASAIDPGTMDAIKQDSATTVRRMTLLPRANGETPS